MAPFIFSVFPFLLLLSVLYHSMFPLTYHAHMTPFPFMFPVCCACSPSPSPPPLCSAASRLMAALSVPGAAVRVLDLGRSRLGAAGAAALGAALRTAPLSLVRLALDDNAMGDAGVAAVVEVRALPPGRIAPRA